MYSMDETLKDPLAIETSDSNIVANVHLYDNAYCNNNYPSNLPRRDNVHCEIPKIELDTPTGSDDDSVAEDYEDNCGNSSGIATLSNSISPKYVDSANPPWIIIAQSNNADVCDPGRNKTWGIPSVNADNSHQFNDKTSTGGLLEESINITAEGIKKKAKNSRNDTPLHARDDYNRFPVVTANRSLKRLSEIEALHKCRPCSVTLNNLCNLPVNQPYGTPLKTDSNNKRKCLKQKKKFKCKICSFACNESNELTLHNYIHINFKSPADNCNLLGNKIVLRETEDSLFQCQVCSFISKEPNDVSSHFDFHAKMTMDPDSYYSKSFFNNYNWEKTKKTLDRTNGIYKCHLCSFSCENFQILVLHNLIHGNTSNNYSDVHYDGNKFNCFLCSFVCEKLNDLALHNCVHVTKKDYTCHLCPFSVGTLIGFRVHLFQHHIEERLQCNFCEFTCADFNEFLLHDSVHYSREWFACSLCPFKDAQMTDFKMHMTSHTQAGYFCRVCPNHASNLKVAQTHLWQHNLVKLYRCLVCPFETKLSSVARAHKLLHKNVKIYNCPKCPYKTLSFSNAEYHKSIHAGFVLFHYIKPSYFSNVEDILRCDSCPFVGSDIGQLTSHELTHFNITLLKDDRIPMSVDSEADCAQLSLNGNDKMSDTLTYVKILLFQCQECTYTCSRIKELNTHKNLHKKFNIVSEIRKCSECSHIGINKYSMDNHRLLHMNMDDMHLSQRRKLYFMVMGDKSPLIEYRPNEVIDLDVSDCEQSSEAKRHKLDNDSAVVNKSLVSNNNKVSRRSPSKKNLQVFIDKGDMKALKNKLLEDLGLLNSTSKSDVSKGNKSVDKSRSLVDKKCKIIDLSYVVPRKTDSSPDVLELQMVIDDSNNDSKKLQMSNRNNMAKSHKSYFDSNQKKSNDKSVGLGKSGKVVGKGNKSNFHSVKKSVGCDKTESPKTSFDSNRKSVSKNNYLADQPKITVSKNIPENGERIIIGKNILPPKGDKLFDGNEKTAVSSETLFSQNALEKEVQSSDAPRKLVTEKNNNSSQIAVGKNELSGGTKRIIIKKIIKVGAKSLVTTGKNSPERGADFSKLPKGDKSFDGAKNIIIGKNFVLGGVKSQISIGKNSLENRPEFHFNINETPKSDESLDSYKNDVNIIPGGTKEPYKVDQSFDGNKKIIIHENVTMNKFKSQVSSVRNESTLGHESIVPIGRCGGSVEKSIKPADSDVGGTTSWLANLRQWFDHRK